MIYRLRIFLWKLLGIDYRHIIRVVDVPFLKNDKFTTIGKGSYDNQALVYRWSTSPLVIGKYCAISYGVKFIIDDGKHHSNCTSSYPFKVRSPKDGGITIGNDTWIGMNTIILNGVTIGNGVTIAASSVVTKSIPDYCVVGGVPAKIIRHKCAEDEKLLMNEIAWWNWPDQTIEANTSDFDLPIQEFINKYASAVHSKI